MGNPIYLWNVSTESEVADTRGSTATPSFFLMKKTGDAIGDLEGQICPEARFSSMKTSSCSCSFGENR
jgi:thioredoxin-related protein